MLPCLKEKEELEKNSRFTFGQDFLKLYDAYYQEQPDSIKLEQNPFLKKLCNS